MIFVYYFHQMTNILFSLALNNKIRLNINLPFRQVFFCNIFHNRFSIYLYHFGTVRLCIVDNSCFIFIHGYNSGVIERKPQDRRYSTFEPDTNIKDIYRPDLLMIDYTKSHLIVAFCIFEFIFFFGCLEMRIWRLEFLFIKWLYHFDSPLFIFSSISSDC